MTHTLLVPWTGPHGGVPPFDRAEPASIEAAYSEGIGLMRGEVRAIADSPEPPTFENTVAALENSGRELAQVETLLRAFASVKNDDAMRDVQQRLAPLRPGLADEIAHATPLFARIAAVLADPQLTPEQRRVTELHHRQLARRGAGVRAADRARLAAINARAAELQAKFAQNLLADEEREHVLVDDPADLDGLDPAARAVAVSAAEAHGHSGRWAITNDRAAVTGVLTSAHSRDLRARVAAMWTSRGGKTNPPIIAELLALRGEKARLLGFPNFAAYALDDRMARTPQAALALLQRVWRGALAVVAEQSRALEAMAVEDGVNAPLAPSDRAYYAERLRRERFGFDESTLTPYLAFEPMLDATFWVAERLYGLTFTPTTGIPTIHPDVPTFAVARHGEPLGALWVDPFVRAGKAGGAFMDQYRGAEHFRGPVPPLVSINLNITPPPPGEPALLTWEGARTLFHEMGHALHALMSRSAYPTLGSMMVPQDFVELPSQLNERWLEVPELLARFARHHATGDPIPPALVAKVEAARAFELPQWTAMLASAIVDMRVHMAADGGVVDAAAIEAATMAELDMPADLEPRHRPSHFQHIFAGDYYAAGYYAYAWADAMVADAAEAFSDAPGSWFDPDIAARYAALLEGGNAKPAETAFHAFRGREPDPDALIRRVGIAA